MWLVGWLFAAGFVVSLVVAPAIGVITHNGVVGVTVFLVGVALVTAAQILALRLGG